MGGVRVYDEWDGVGGLGWVFFIDGWMGSEGIFVHSQIDTAIRANIIYLLASTLSKFVR